MRKLLHRSMFNWFKLPLLSFYCSIMNIFTYTKVNFLNFLRNGTGCSERLWSVHPWRYSKAVWTQFWATGSRVALLEQGVLDQMTLQKSLPTSTILWFCASVKLSSETSPYKMHCCSSDNRLQVAQNTK